jgi:hypothetical protein
MDIKIEKASPTCKVCGRNFRENEHFTAALKHGAADDEYSRTDICNGCWPDQNAKTFVCHWVSTSNVKRRPALLDSDVLWQALQRSLPAEGNPGQPDVAYVAALGLMRLKQLTLEDTRRESTGEIMVFRDKGKPQREYQIADPRLDEAALTRVQDKLDEAAAASE